MQVSAGEFNFYTLLHEEHADKCMQFFKYLKPGILCAPFT